MSGAPLMADGGAGRDEGRTQNGEFFNESDAETVATIKDLIETRVRPAVANDGGDITFRGFKDGTVFLQYEGLLRRLPVLDRDAAARHPEFTRHFVPDVVEVRPI